VYLAELIERLEGFAMVANIPMYLATDGLTTVVPMILSIEYVEITVPWDATSASVALTKGQNTANCVPFHSVDIVHPWAYMKHILYDVYFSGSTVVAERFEAISADDGDSIISVFVVEFSPSQVRVQQGTFSLPSLASDTYSIGTAVDLSKAALTFSWKKDGTTPYPNGYLIRGRITSANELTFDRGGAFGTPSGHWFVFEALSNQFTVQAKSFYVDTLTHSEPIDEVDLSKTILLGSHHFSTSDRSKGRFTIGLYLGSSTSIDLVTNGTGSGYSKDVSAFVVTFTDSVSVQRGILSWADEDLIQNTALGSLVDKSKSIINKIQKNGLYYVSSLNVGSYCAIYCRTEFNEDGSVVNGSRTKNVGFSDDIGTTYFEVAEFDF
jgi:hypothetical protein